MGPIPRRALGSSRPTIAIDFDGVIHAYTQGWQGGEIYDEPVPHTADALRELAKHYELVVFTARHDLPAVETWLQKHRLRHYFKAVTNRKPAAKLYIDDRAFKFESWEQTLEGIRAA